jgi:hypothetical protein
MLTGVKNKGILKKDAKRKIDHSNLCAVPGMRLRAPGIGPSGCNFLQNTTI